MDGSVGALHETNVGDQRACVPECPRAEPTQLSQLISAPFRIKSRGVGSGDCPTRSLHRWLGARRSGASRRSGGGATLLGCPPGLSLSLRHRASTPVRRAACCAGGFVCVALVESILRPSGWEKKCRLTCHCVRHISPDNKHGQPVKARHSLPSRWRAGTELCVPTNRKSRAARRARWGARTVPGARAGFGSPSWFGQFPPGLTAQVSKLVEHS